MEHSRSALARNPHKGSYWAKCQEEWSENPATRTRTSGSQDHRRCAYSTSTAAAIFTTANSSLARPTIWHALKILYCPPDGQLSRLLCYSFKNGNTISFSYIKFIRSNYHNFNDCILSRSKILWSRSISTWTGLFRGQQPMPSISRHTSLMVLRTGTPAGPLEHFKEQRSHWGHSISEWSRRYEHNNTISCYICFTPLSNQFSEVVHGEKVFPNCHPTLVTCMAWSHQTWTRRLMKGLRRWADRVILLDEDQDPIDFPTPAESESDDDREVHIEHVFVQRPFPGIF